MATLVLTTLGTALGGPIGGALGAMLGNTIDRELLFRPRGRSGPRLAELAVQTSSYGRPIPRVFGTMRVAGTVIWAADLIEQRHRQGGGKGQPAVTSYSYAASFAVALSSRPILGVGRIWAEGSLLRGAGGDWKAATGFRLHTGGEDQPPDPLIASAEGIGMTPAHRGIAYAVFEGLALESFGNRIPSLTFEVIADPGPVAAGAIAREIGSGAIVGTGAALPLDGLAAEGEDARATLELLGNIAGGWFGPVAGGIALHGDPGVPASVVEVGVPGRGSVRALAAMDAVPHAVSVAHHDPARDWQAGVQRAERPGAGRRSLSVEAPVALSAAAAKGVAEAMLARAEAGRATRRVVTDDRAMGIAPGAAVTLAGETGVWRVMQAAVERGGVTLDLAPLAPAPLIAPASGGRVLAAPDVAHGRTILHAFETPALDGALLATPRLTIVAAGTEPGWRRAALLYSLDDGASWSEAGATAAPAVIGTIVVPPAPGPATLADRVATIEVELAHGGMVLASADRAALDGGANLALVGGELVQFADAVPLGGRRWRIAGLWRRAARCR